MRWNYWWLSFARKKFSKTGFAAGGGVFVQDVAFGGFVEFFVEDLKEVGRFFFVRHGLKFFDGFFEVGLDVQITHVALAVDA